MNAFTDHPMTATTLYLVSAEKNGIGYWKVGITHHADPLKRDRKHYREVFRAVRFFDYQYTDVWGTNRLDAFSQEEFDEMYADPDWFNNNADTTTENDAALVEAFIKESFKKIGLTVGTEGISQDASLASVLALFDLVARYWRKDLADAISWEINGFAFDCLVEALESQIQAEVTEAIELRNKAKCLQPMWN